MTLTEEEYQVLRDLSRQALTDQGKVSQWLRMTRAIEAREGLRTYTLYVKWTPGGGMALPPGTAFPNNFPSDQQLTLTRLRSEGQPISRAEVLAAVQAVCANPLTILVSPYPDEIGWQSLETYGT